MWKELDNKHEFDADGQQYEIRWKIEAEDSCRLEVYKMPQDESVLAIESNFPHGHAFIENDAYRKNLAEKIEKMFRGESLSLGDIIG